MGVLGLWNLIEESGTRVNIETLNDKVLAVDLSIWINQAIKGFRDKDGRSLDNAHILGLFHRICKLLFYGIKPIFVFDGESPLLKSRTAVKRREKTQKSLDKAKNMSLNILEKFALSQYSQQTNLKQSTKATFSNNNSKSPKKPNDVYENFVEMLKNFENKIDENNSESDLDETYNSIEENLAYSFPMGDCQNIRNIDIKSNSFLSLSAVARYEILKEMRESYKGRKNPFPEKLPNESDEFSSFQMTKLLKKRSLQDEIDKVIDELNGRDDIDNKDWAKLFDLDEKCVEKIFSGKLASDEKTKFLFLKRIVSNKTNLQEDKEDSEEKSFLENSKIECKDEQSNKEISAAFELPNKLLDQSEHFSDSQRIEHLSQLRGSQSKNDITRFNSTKLMGQLEKNLNKAQPSTSSNTQDSKFNVKLSDDEETSEDDDADMVNIEEYNMQVKGHFSQSGSSSSSSKNLFEDLILPYNTDYSLTIEVPSDIEKNIGNFSETISKVENNNEKMKNAQNKNEISLNVLENTKLKSKSERETEINQFEFDFEVQQTKSSFDKGSTENKQDKDSQLKAVCLSLPLIIPTVSEQKKQNDKSTEIVDVEKLIQDSKRANTIARQAMSVNQQMLDDCQKLLRLFGCPFLTSPAEAEAQCATLEKLGLCEGIITDDSDIFLFGGQTVYKNFFSNDKFITQFRADDLERFYGLNRSKLICLGMMCGTDYTIGIDGIGPVNGLEILGEFPGKNLKPLEEFASWYRSRKAVPNSPPENKIRSKLLRFKLPSTFPSRIVYDAYYNANTDKSKKPFSWSMPQLYELRIYALKNFGWSIQKSDALLLPILRNFNKKNTQKKLELYFPTVSRDSAVNEKLRMNRSKRLNAAIHQSITITQNQREKSTKELSNRVSKKPVSKSSKRKSPKRSKLELSEESSNDED